MRDRFWVVPLLFAIGATLLGLALTALDDWLDTSLTLPLLFAGGPEGARAVLSAIITSMISFTGLVFSITVVVLQLTSSQFSPRILRTFLRDWVNQIALGVFVATFVYALVVLRAVTGTAQTDTFVPQISVTMAFGLVLASVVVFLFYIDHIAQSIRAASIVTRIAEETRALLEQRHPSDAVARPSLPRPVTEGRRILADAPGVVQQVDDQALLSLAEEHGVTICVLRALGEFVPEGAALLEVHGEGEPDEAAIRSHVHLGKERSTDQDVGFGFRQLVDIAERALSPGVNDPTTAVQVIDQLHDLLRRLVTRPLPPWQLVTDSGRLAVDVAQPTFAHYLALAVDEIAHWGADVERVQARLAVMLRDLQGVALPAHEPAVRRAVEAFADHPPDSRAGTDPEPTDSGLR